MFPAYIKVEHQLTNMPNENDTCVHDDVEISSDKDRSAGWHTYRCRKCDRTYSLDSSG